MGMQNTMKALSDPIRREILGLLKQYGVKQCCYGHLHGWSHRMAVTGQHEGIDFHLVAADYLQFVPKCLIAE